MMWESVTLDKLGRVSRGKSKHRPRNDSSLFGGDYPFIQTADVKSAPFYITKYSETYNEKGLAQSKLWGKGTLCITIAANIADTAILDIDACFPDSIMGFIPYEEVSDVRFVKYAFDLLQRDMKQISQGTAQDNLSWQKLSTIRFPKPPLEVQRKIADYLGVYEDLLENNLKQIKLLDEMVGRLYKEWFVDFRFPGHKDIDIVDGVPKGWHKDTVDSRISLLSGYAFKSSEFTEIGKYKIVTIKNVKDGYFEPSNMSLLEDIPSKMPDYCKLEEGDILVSLTGNVGRVCMVYGEKYLLNQRVAKVKSDIPGFAYCLFRSKDMFDEMNNLANGTAQQNLSPVRTGKIDVTFPSEEIIRCFENIVRPMLDIMVNLNKMNIILTEARNRLLAKLMSGEIEV